MFQGVRNVNGTDAVMNASKVPLQGMTKKCDKIFECNFLLVEKHLKDLGKNELLKVGDL